MKLAYVLILVGIIAVIVMAVIWVPIYAGVVFIVLVLASVVFAKGERKTAILKAIKDLLIGW